MSNMQAAALHYIQRLSGEKLNSALDYLRYLCEQDHPLDEYDYELSRLADEDTSTETISFEQAMQQMGISYEDLQD